MKTTALVLALVCAVVALGCRATETRPDGETAPQSSATPAESLFNDVYRSLATLRLLMEDAPDQSQQESDSEQYLAECADLPGGCNLESFRLFYANQPEGPARAYYQARKGCGEALESEEVAGQQREALAGVCGELSSMVLATSSFAVDLAALDAAIARLAAVAN